MSSYTQSIQNLMNQLASLPGIGMRSAERIAFHILKQKPEDAMQLAEAIRDVGPYGLDVCSGVRTDGLLDEAKLRGFFAEVKEE